MDAMLAKKNLSEKEKEAILREILGKDYVSAGNNLPVGGEFQFMLQLFFRPAALFFSFASDWHTHQYGL